jgi:hypothetical protein
MRRGWFRTLLSAALVFQFLTSMELFLLMTMVGGAVLAGCVAVMGERRRALFDALKLVLIAYVIAGVVVSPLLVTALGSSDTLNAIDPIEFGADPVNFVVPTETIRLGGSAFDSISARFSGTAPEHGAYFGLPLLIAIGAFAFESRRRKAWLVLPLGFLAVIVASLGARLTVLGGISEVRLPWTPMIHLPILEYVLPARLIAFAWLFAAATVALWLSGRDRHRLRLGLGALVVISLFPQTGGALWSLEPPVPRFFREGGAEKVVGDDATLLVLPYPPAGDAKAMLWQAEEDLDFGMAGGYVSSSVPPDYACWPLPGHMRSGVYGADVRPELPGFLASKQVDAVVATPEEAARAAPLRLSRLLGPPIRWGGALVYLVPDWIQKLPPEDCPPGFE